MFSFFSPTVPSVSVEHVKQTIDTKQPCILVDVRTPGEYSRGTIAGSINIPLDDLPEKIAAIIPDTSANVYVYCLSGSRSIHAVSSMIGLGYTQVFNVTSGLLAWRAKGYSLVTQPDTTKPSD